MPKGAATEARRRLASGEDLLGGAGALRVVELAQRQQMALTNASAAPATILEDAPVAVLLAVLAAGSSAREHTSSLKRWAGK